MTVKAVELYATPGAATSRVRSYLRQALMVVLINVPAMSFGLAVGWVSLASGESGAGGALDEAQAVAAAGTTYLASLVGVPLCARALAGGRKPAVIATSAAFVMSHLPQACWGLKLCGGGWWVVAARACAGVGGAGAWCLAPLLANEVCMVCVCVVGAGGAVVYDVCVCVCRCVQRRRAARRRRRWWRRTTRARCSCTRPPTPGSRTGTAASRQPPLYALPGLYVMYLQLMARCFSALLWSCLALSAAHCVLYLLVPESPAFLAAAGRADEARASLAWLRGLPADAAALHQELAALPPPDHQLASAYSITKRFCEYRSSSCCCVCAINRNNGLPTTYNLFNEANLKTVCVAVTHRSR
ncbi:unnamed protein product [Spodoptera exigua]|nr:unnamed protein product [Spodoptera exigua]